MPGSTWPAQADWATNEAAGWHSPKPLTLIGGEASERPTEPELPIAEESGVRLTALGDIHNRDTESTPPAGFVSVRSHEYLALLKLAAKARILRLPEVQDEIDEVLRAWGER